MGDCSSHSKASSYCEATPADDKADLYDSTTTYTGCTSAVTVTDDSSPDSPTLKPTESPTRRPTLPVSGGAYCTQPALSDTSSYATGTASPNNEYTYSVAASGGDISGTASLFASYQSAFTNPLSLPTKPFCFEFSIADSSKWQAVSWCGGAMLLLATALASCWSAGLPFAGCWPLPDDERREREGPLFYFSRSPVPLFH